MMNRKYFAIAVLFIGEICCSDLEDKFVKNVAPIITIKQGQLKGIVQTTLFGRNIFSFLSVRYAAAPIGELRFQPPQPPKAWQGVYDATEDSPACPQPPFGTPTSEDCLFINVHTPRLNNKFQKRKLLPVILFIHGGSYNTLTGASSWVQPHYLLDHDVVLASFNYRLATLGFIATGDKLAPGNNGLKDQVQAMRWIRDNIEEFGGNPDSVTIAGYSVGGISAAFHMMSPMSKGLFHKVFIMGGSPFGNVMLPTSQFDLAQKQAQILGCPDDSSANIINCLKTKPAEEFGNSLGDFRVFGNDPGFIWQMVLEPDFGQERFLIENPLVSIQCGRIAKVPVFTGITKEELVSLAYPVVSNKTWADTLNNNFNEIAPYAFYYERNTPRSKYLSEQLKIFYFKGENIKTNSLVPLGELYSDSLSGYAVNRGARLLSRYCSDKIYNYIFSYKGRYTFYPGGSFKYAVHFDDLLYVFWNSALFPMFNRTDPEIKVVKALTTLWANFATHGNPTPTRVQVLDWVHWNRFNPHTKKYLNIGLSLRMEQNLYPNRYQEWDRLLPLPVTNCKP